MRVASDQLLGAVVRDLRELAGAALLEQQRQEIHLEQHVAELVEHLGVVAPVRGVGELVGLLDRVRARSSARPARDPTGTRLAAGA